jgi:hypothetical protein
MTVIDISTGQSHPLVSGEGLWGVIDLALHQRAQGGQDIAPQAAMHLHRQRQDSVNMPRYLEAKGMRRDAATAGGNAFPRQLEHVYARLLEEKVPVPNGLSKFRIDQSVPPGARTHTVRRVMYDGQVRVHRGTNEDVPRSGWSQKEQQFPVRHYVTSIATNVFELLSSNYANLGDVERKMRSARRAMDAFINRMTWFGSKADDIYGVLTYPWLPKKIVATAFVAGADPDDVLAELNALVNYPTERSKSVFAPNRLVVSPRIRNFLMNTRIGTVSEMTIGKFFLENNEHISQIESAWELEACGPNGEDGILVYNDSEDGVANVIPQGLTPLPQQSFGFDNITFMYASHGGVIMRDVGNNILGFVQAEA